MVKYTLKRLLMAVVTLWVIITMTFVLKSVSSRRSWPI